MTTYTPTDLEQRLAELAVADAPAFSADQIVELRRVLKPYVSPTVAPTAAAKSQRSQETGSRRAA